jgi:Tfp pilus assembly protein PilV
LKTNNKKANKGASLIEALISVGIISFVVVSILSGFTQQQANTSQNTDHNMAVMLAEMRMEELLKFPSTQLTEETFVDYVVLRPSGFDVYDGSEGNPIPNTLRQLRRTATITREDLLQQLATIRVVVEYGAMKGSGTEMVYPFRVDLTSRRSLK